MITFAHDEAAQRYTAHHEGHVVGRINYRIKGAQLVIEETEISSRLRGQGVAGKLTRHVLDEARTDGRSVVVECPFVADFLTRHPEYCDVL